MLAVLDDGRSESDRRGGSRGVLHGGEGMQLEKTHDAYEALLQEAERRLEIVYLIKQPAPPSSTTPAAAALPTRSSCSITPPPIYPTHEEEEEQPEIEGSDGEEAVAEAPAARPSSAPAAAGRGGRNGAISIILNKACKPTRISSSSTPVRAKVYRTGHDVPRHHIASAAKRAVHLVYKKANRT